MPSCGDFGAHVKAKNLLFHEVPTQSMPDLLHSPRGDFAALFTLKSEARFASVVVKATAAADVAKSRP